MRALNAFNYLPAHHSFPFVLDPHACTTPKRRGFYECSDSTRIVRNLVLTLHDSRVKFHNVATLISKCDGLRPSRGYHWILTHLRSKLVLRAIKSNYKAASTDVVVTTETFAGVTTMRLLIHFLDKDTSSGRLLSARQRERLGWVCYGFVPKNTSVIDSDPLSFSASTNLFMTSLGVVAPNSDPQ